VRKPAIIIFGLGIVLALVTYSSGCKKKASLGSEYTIQIDSIKHADTITVGETLEIKFYGLVGETNCYSFYKFNINFDQDKINVTAIGLNSESEDCKDGNVILDGESASIYSLPEGHYTIIVNQPRDNKIESPVVVSP
jgi:hypothetical protein